MADAFLGISSDPVRFDEAIAALRRRVPMTEDAFSALEQEELQFAFTVADVAQLDVVLDVYEAIQSAVADGTTFEDFKASVGEQLEAAWGVEDGARLDAVFRTNVMTAYNGGRHAAAMAVKDDRPYWRFDGADDGRTSDICRPCIGVILPADHPWWRTHYPILHPNCFEPGASVTTSAGPVPIEDVKLGDIVLTHRGRFREVTGLLRSPAPKALFHVDLVGGGHASGGTAEHPAFTDRGWVELAALRPGDRILHARKLTPDNVKVRDGHHQDPVFEERLQPGGRYSVRVLGEFDGEIGGREEEVDEEEVIAENERLLKCDIPPGAGDPIKEDSLDSRWPDAVKAVRRRICAVENALGCIGLFQRLWSLGPTAVGELLRHARDAGVGLLRVALVPCRATASLTPFLNRGEVGSSGGTPGLVVSPLPSHRLGAVAKWNAVLFQKPFGRPGTVRVADDRGDLSNRQSTLDVEPKQVSAESGAVDLEQLALDWSHADIFMPTWEEVQWVGIRPFDGPTVYNFSVEEDESYVVDGMVVHNCRHRVSTLTKAQAEREGITAHPPSVDVPAGFGLAPSSAGGSSWEPDPEDYPDDLREALEDRLDETG